MSSRVNVPELKAHMDARVVLVLNAGRRVAGTLRGYDPFMNVVLDDAEDGAGARLGQVMVRGNSILSLEQQ